jgi:hypothetical protein
VDNVGRDSKRCIISYLNKLLLSLADLKLL